MPPPPANSDQARWFSQEVQPHEPALRSYLRATFPTVRDVDDVVQESYLRTWKTAATNRISSARAFLFRVARNLALDVVRHESVSPLVPMGSLAGLSVLDDRADAAEVLTREEKGRLLGQALAALPARCREILFLHKIKGLSQRAVAEQFGLSRRPWPIRSHLV
jgi:RNA polymerase sigma-70 factor (ECF subfamily)